MKRLLIVMAVALTSVSALRAYEFPGFEYTVGADLTTAYLWRGMNYGGLAFQPAANIGYAGLNLEMWWNLSPEDYTFKTFAPEVDLSLSYSIVGLTVGAYHYHYFDGSPYFSFGKETGNQTEVFAEFNLADVAEDFPFHVGWYTMVGGDDTYEQINGTDTTLTRAFSTYIDVSYEFGLPLGFSLTPTVGMSPWKSMYNYYEDGFSVNNIQLRADWKLELFKHAEIDVYAQVALNTAGITKDNIITGLDNTYSADKFSQRLNAGVGVCFSFY